MRTSTDARYPKRTLRSLTVTNVFPNGLATRFRQVVFQPLTDEAAAGAVDVVVTNPGGATARRTSGFTFVSGNPTDDADGDGLPDVWETQYGLDPARLAGTLDLLAELLRQSLPQRI